MNPKALLDASRERGDGPCVIPAAAGELNSWMIFLPNCVNWGNPTPFSFNLTSSISNTSGVLEGKSQEKLREPSFRVILSVL